MCFVRLQLTFPLHRKRRVARSAALSLSLLLEVGRGQFEPSFGARCSLGSGDGIMPSVDLTSHRWAVSRWPALSRRPGVLWSRRIVHPIEARCSAGARGSGSLRPARRFLSCWVSKSGMDTPMTARSDPAMVHQRLCRPSRSHAFKSRAALQPRA